MTEVKSKESRRMFLGLEIATIALFYFLEYLRVIGLAYVVSQPHAPGQTTSLFKDFDDSNVFLLEIIIIVGSFLFSGIPICLAPKSKGNMLAFPLITILNLPIIVKAYLYVKLCRGGGYYILPTCLTVLQFLAIEIGTLIGIRGR